jgi:hypothetical protein
MLVDHLPFLFPGVFTIISRFYEAWGYVSVTEAFVFLSGYVTGSVYARVKQEKGGRAVCRKTLLRAFAIYATYLAGVVLLLLMVRLEGVSDVSWGTWNHLLEEPLPSASAQVASLLWQPASLEILPNAQFAHGRSGFVKAGYTLVYQGKGSPSTWLGHWRPMSTDGILRSLRVAIKQPAVRWLLSLKAVYLAAVLGAVGLWNGFDTDMF